MKDTRLSRSQSLILTHTGFVYYRREVRVLGSRFIGFVVLAHECGGEDGARPLHVRQHPPLYGW
jgi:hypothetical protein